MKLDISTTKKEKVKLLNDIRNGKISLKDLLPPQFGDVWLSSSDGLTLENLKTGEIITSIEFEKRCEKDGIKPITFK